ncbi:MAG: 30S ribosomal protein S6 [Lachnospiraceae bacterium]|nr:30S ribosomal protein S6 [Lachnospiraceae bacterium]
MNKYELAVVLSSKIEDEDRAAAMEKVKNYIATYGGTITGIDDWGKKRLAYEIQKMKEGYYTFITFEAEADCPAQLESHIRVMEPVIRFLIVRPEE